MKEFDIAHELEANVRHVQEELAAFRKQQSLLNDSAEMAHAELLRMKEEALHYSADLRRALMDLADSHAVEEARVVRARARKLVLYSSFACTLREDAPSCTGCTAPIDCGEGNSADFKRASLMANEPFF